MNSLFPALVHVKTTPAVARRRTTDFKQGLLVRCGATCSRLLVTRAYTVSLMNQLIYLVIKYKLHAVLDCMACMHSGTLWLHSCMLLLIYNLKCSCARLTHGSDYSSELAAVFAMPVQELPSLCLTAEVCSSSLDLQLGKTRRHGERS
jgi:hypothetical protein